MIIDIGHYLSAAIALTILLIGANFFIAPYAAAEGFGVAVVPDVRWDAYLSVKAIRDVGAGIFTAMLQSIKSTARFFLAGHNGHSANRCRDRTKARRHKRRSIWYPRRHGQHEPDH